MFFILFSTILSHSYVDIYLSYYIFLNGWWFINGSIIFKKWNTVYIGGTHKVVGFSVEHADGNPLTLLEFRQMPEYKDNVFSDSSKKTSLSFVVRQFLLSFEWKSQRGRRWGGHLVNIPVLLEMCSRRGCLVTIHLESWLLLNTSCFLWNTVPYPLLFLIFLGLK